MNIRIRQYTPPQITAFRPDGTLLGYINHYVELQRLMEDVRNNNASGYYIIYANKKIQISEDGKIGVDNVVLIQDLFQF